MKIQAQLSELHAELGVAMIYVTRDHVDGMTRRSQSRLNQDGHDCEAVSVERFDISVGAT